MPAARSRGSRGRAAVKRASGWMSSMPNECHALVTDVDLDEAFVIERAQDPARSPTVT
jgi:hypothetical protein